MEDVRANFNGKAQELRDYSLAQFNNLSGLYLRDVIRGTADQYSPSQLSQLDESSLANILSRVSEQVLSPEDKKLLREKIIHVRGLRRSEIDVNDRYLAHYFTRLVSASADIAKKETEVTAFVDVCNSYLLPGKEMVYDEKRFMVSIHERDGSTIDLSVLSSGEKQIVSIFSHLYLDNSLDQIVIIDEPELSLSVPWQKQFLTDILDSGYCDFVFAVTHSPFIYQNRLAKKAVDLRRRTKPSSER
jgi:predicted ATP-dependent endonuclease of OLD family